MNYDRRLLPVFAAFSLMAGAVSSPVLASSHKAPPAKSPGSAQLTSYIKLVKARLDHHFSPAAASDAHAVVTFRITKDGRIYWLELTDVSATAAVNQAAEDAVASCSPLPALPNGLDHLDLAASFDSNVENSTRVHYSRPSPDRAKEARKRAADATNDMASKRYMAAVENMQKALLLTPFDVNLQDKAAAVYVAAAKNCKQDEEYSKQLLHEALLIDPQNELARSTWNELWKNNEVGSQPFDWHLKLAREYKAKGKPVDAMAEYGEAWRLKQDPTLISEINAVCKLQEAFRTLEKWKAIAERSRTAENLQIVAKAYEQCGDLVNAKAYYQAVKGLDPGCEGVPNWILQAGQPVPDAALVVTAAGTVDPGAAAAAPQLSDVFPYVRSGFTSVKLQEVKNRQPNVDYMKWACAGNAVHRWTPGKFPLRLYVESGFGVRGWKPQSNKLVVEALAAWCAASENRITFVQVFDRRGANITCKWTAQPEKIKLANAQGITEFEYMRGQAAKGATSNDTISKGDITILTTSRQTGEVFPDFVMKSVCLHEVGHALGLAGHSPYTSDVMYPSLHLEGVITSLSLQDKNTIKRLYQGYEHPAK